MVEILDTVLEEVREGKIVMGVSTTPTHSYYLYLATAVNIYLEKHFTLSPEREVFRPRV